jgi:hypothetical protein
MKEPRVLQHARHSPHASSMFNKGTFHLELPQVHVYSLRNDASCWTSDGNFDTHFDHGLHFSELPHLFRFWLPSRIYEDDVCATGL